MYQLAQLLLCALLLTACVASTEETATQVEQAALIIQPDAGSRAELLQVIKRALHNPNLTLANDALTHDSQLVLEHPRIVAADGTRLNGRELDMPEQFHLIKSGQRCVLVQTRSQLRWTLFKARCSAVAASRQD